MTIRLFLGALLGFASSKLLFAPTHRHGFPELGRYSIGILTVALALKMSGATDDDVAKFLITAGACGMGVAAARLW